MTEREAIDIATRFMAEEIEVGFELIGARLTSQDDRTVWRVMFELKLAIKIDPDTAVVQVDDASGEAAAVPVL